MNRIDRLLMNVRAVTHGGMELLPSFVRRNGNSWTAEAYLGDGIQGHPPTVKTATCATETAAVEYIRALAGEYPNSRDVPIIIDDL